MIDVSNLVPITADEWPHVRDIVLPVERSAGGGDNDVAETLLQEAVCFLGDLQARRLWNPADPALAQKILPVAMAAHEFVAREQQRFRIDQSGMSFRGQYGRNSRGHDVTLRVLPQDCPTLNDLLLPPAIRALFLSRELLDGGLLLIVGPFGQGKTTTASAILRSRLQVFGGYALTVEDPCELPLQATWGNGLCVQRPVEPLTPYEAPGDAFFRSLIATLRQFPAIPYGTMLFVGEIQDGRTAVETLKAAVNGHLVIATLHARSPIEAIRRMSALCANDRDNLDADTARDMLAAALRGVWHQRLTWLPKGEGWARGEIAGQILWQSEIVMRQIRTAGFETLLDVTAKQNEAIRAFATSKVVTSDEVSRALRSK
jgi:twitching motility protein PilT